MRAVWLIATLLLGCPSALPPEPSSPSTPQYPSMMVRPEHRPLILDRLDREPYVTIWADIQATAAEDYEQDDPDAWSASINGRNAERAQANALIAWLMDDEGAADRARAGLDTLGTHWDTHGLWDINIRMPHSLMGYVNALDLLRATPWLPADEALEARRTLTSITDQFFAWFLLDEGVRAFVLGPSQNNHPIRTAAAIGYVALAFPDHPNAPLWRNWAFSELQYLWGPEGRYVQEDGGVSEGPFYFGFAWGVAAAIFIAVDNLHGDAPLELVQDCRNRNDRDPWAPISCVDGAPFTFANPLREPMFAATVDWSLALSLPWGSRPPLADAYFNPFNGGALLSSFGGDGRYAWDWLGNRDRPLELHHGADLTAHHLAYYDDAIPAAPPPWTHRFLPAAGNAVLRSSWEQDALWMLLVGEAGPARKTLHDHVDGTSVTLAAFGEYLLIDPGYYKPFDLDNAQTAHSPSHNVVLIDGRSAPNKGLLTNWGDADAELLAFDERGPSAFSVARQTYQETTVTRTAVLVDGLFGVVFDRLETTATDAREHRWRMHGYAGYTSGGSFALTDDGAVWERPSGVGVTVVVASPAGLIVAEEPPYAVNAPPHVHQFELDRAVADHAVLDGVITEVAPDFLAILAPYAGATPTVQALDVGQGVAFAVTAEGGDYVVSFDGAAGAITAPDWTLDLTADGAIFSP